ncbi:hypothetical protein MAM1_0006c00728 [Mucor ambiguus]|uniref:Rap-GAP domain-containing protein n=1 Tax=Mucor ambiguus TaxID=91626 RepID=A0A0C9LQ86_9FUNG|nr:hypothetical protein MAM1_0006c00728 [Mucor ambiguus]
MDNSNKRYSHDSACDSVAGDESNNISYFKARDDASIYSTNSTTSSMFSTSSRLSKIPNAVKSSMKYLVRRNKNRSNEATSASTATTDHETFSSKLKRTTINFSLFSRKSPEVIPTSTTSSTLFQQSHRSREASEIHKKSARRNSVVNVYKKDNDNVVVGSLLFGKQVDDLEFMVHEEQAVSDSKSEKLSPKPKKEEPWIRQRAKSCQENKTPMLRQLATKNSSCNLPESDSIPYKSSKPIKSDLPLFKGLVTTTLTTLHTRLSNECDRALSLVLLANSHNNNSNDNNANIQQTNTNIPREQLLSILTDLHKMTEMVNWDQQSAEKDEIKSHLQTLEDTVLMQELTIAVVKDVVSTMKHIMNQCICQYYKVVEKAIVIPSKGYKIEGINKYGSTNSALMIRDETIDYSKSPIDHKDTEAHWYRTYFQQDDNEIHTFFGYYKSGDPVLISIQVEQEQGSDRRQYRIIHRSKQVMDQRKVIRDSFLLSAPTTTPLDTSLPSLPAAAAIIQDSTWKTIIETTVPDISFQDLVRLSKDQLVSSGIHEELVRLDETSLHTRYKFGVLLIQPGQTKEEDWFSNQHTDELEAFLGIIGRKVALKGYTGWAAGLDTKSGDSGEYTYTNAWNENILAYHVSTLIPSKPGDKQQIQRKRHIGNDIVCIVFVQGNQPFNPSAIKSQFLHVFIVVHQETVMAQVVYRVEIVSVQDVPDFGPPLPEKSAIFNDKKELEQFLIAKLVNAEYAAFKSPKFAVPMSRAREGIFTNLVEKGYKLALEEIQTEESAHVRKHSKSASSSSSQSSFNSIPSPSKSTIIREISENIVGLGRRRSTQDLNDRPKSTSSNSMKHFQKGSRKFTEGSKRSHSEQDLLNMTIAGSTEMTTAKTSFKNRILTSIPGFGSSSNSGSSSTSANHQQQQQMMENDK